MSLRLKISNGLWEALAAALGAYGLTVLYASAVVPGVWYPYLAAWTFALCAGLALLRRLAPWKIRGPVYILIVIWLLASALLYHGAAGEGLNAAKALVQMLNGATAAAYIYAPQIRLVLLALFVFICNALMSDEVQESAVVMTVLLCVAGFFIPMTDAAQAAEESRVYALIPVAGCILIKLVPPSGRKTAALPVTAALAVAAFMLLPPAGTVQETLSDTAQDMQDMAEDYLFFTEERSSFSLTGEGWQPLEERLGGPVHPNAGHRVMDLSGASGQRVYLRASAMDEYSGLNWYDTVSSRRYLYGAPSAAALKAQVFEEALPYAGADEKQDKLNVHMLSDASTTLFLPVRMRSVNMLSSRMVPYFNEGGEMFITRDLAAGDAYEVSYLSGLADVSTLKALSAANANMPDSAYAGAMERYLSVPEHTQQEVIDIALRATQGLIDPLDKALAIRDYLIVNYTYTLTPEVPPAQYDFAAYFLIASKEGYCTYFATAEALLCRIAGVPSRYVIGYAADLDAAGHCTVTGEHAHAWCEIYLSGVGWCIMEATPGRIPNENRDDTPPDTTLTPTPAPTPTPEPSPGREDSEEPDIPPQQSETPAPSPEPEPSPGPDDTSGSEDPKERRSSMWWLWLLLLLVLALVILRIRLTDPEKQAARHPEKAGKIYFDAALRILRMQGFVRRPQETLTEFSERARYGESMEKAVEEAQARIYGRSDASLCAASRAWYLSLWHRSSLKTRAGSVLLRILPGSSRR